tara:strand:+ start:2274 stop:4241 length:1968 start_codon:yes stop_codon:yes gene_type:complete
MGNALDAAKFSILQGNTGVGTKKELLAGIDRGIEGVKTWKSNIDQQRLDLKKNTAEKYRQAELKTMENLPSDKTSRDLAIKALANYKDRLYGNMGLVQSGNIKPEDNLIFQENGKQSFDILAQQINGYAKEKENYIKRLKGYYELNEDGTKKTGADGLPIYVPPSSGGVDQSLQDLHDRMGNPDFTDMTFGENGMGRITFYQTKIDETTKTRVLDLDAEGNPQPYDGIKDMSVLAFNNKRNQTAEKVDLAQETKAAIGKDSPLGQIFEKMDNFGKMLGVVTDDMRNNPQLNRLLKDAVSAAAATTDKQASILSDNGPESERSITLNEFESQELEKQGINLDEKIDYTYIDTDPKSETYGEELTGQKSKYIKMVMAKNNQIVPVISASDKLAAERIAGSSFYSGLRRDITDGGTKKSEFQARAKSAATIKKEGDDEDYQFTVKLIDQASTGDVESLQALVNESDIVEKYTIDTIDGKQVLNFYTFSGDKLADILIDGEGKAVGKQIASQLKKQAEKYINKTTLKNEEAKGTDAEFNSRSREYTNLDDVVFGVNNQGVTTTTSDLFADAGKSSGKIKAAFDRTIAEMARLYGFPEGFLTVEIDDTDFNDRMTIRDANGKEIDQFEEDASNGANIKNALDKYMKTVKSGEVKLNKDFG